MTMKKNIFLLVSIGVFFVTIIGCSELQTDITPPVKVTIHESGILNPGSPNFHGKLVKNFTWDLKQCQSCHAVNYTGGTAGKTCLGSGCHTSPKGPEECNTCHGDFTDPNRVSPPRDLSGSASTSSRGVGAHLIHLKDNVLGKKVECAECHKIPVNFSDMGHVDTDLPAEIIFADSLAGYKTPADKKPSYSASTISCSNTYCHGNFTFYRDSAATARRYAYTSDKMVGANRTVKWNKVDGSEIACGTCHGKTANPNDPSPEGHLSSSLTACVFCHAGVVDNTGKIIDKTKHINGKVNALGD